MRIGIIADIHSDHDALEDALDLLAWHQVDEVVCAGDLVERGPDGDAVVSTLRQHEMLCVHGNHDRDAASNQHWLRANRADPSSPIKPGWWLDDETLAYLSLLPGALRFVWEDRVIVLAHGVPWSPDMYLFPFSREQLFAGVAGAADADVVILGHTHIPMRVRSGQTWICNPGSICGTYTNGTRTFGILSLPSLRFDVYGLDDNARMDIAVQDFTRR